MIPKLLIFTTIFFTLIAYPQRASCQFDEYKIKTLYIYNFTKYIVWGAEAQKGSSFVIGIFGNSPIINDLSDLAEIKKVGDKKIVVKKITRVSEIKSCHILYVSAQESSKLAALITNTNNTNTLLVTEGYNLAQKGACINLKNENSKVYVEFNRKAIESRGVKISATLLNLGKVVD